MIVSWESLRSGAFGDRDNEKNRQAVICFLAGLVLAMAGNAPG